MTHQKQTQGNRDLPTLLPPVVYTNIRYACFRRWQTRHATKWGRILPEAPYEIGLPSPPPEKLGCLLISFKKKKISKHNFTWLEKSHIFWHSTHSAGQSVLQLWKCLKRMCPGQCHCALFTGRCFLKNKHCVSRHKNPPEPVTTPLKHHFAFPCTQIPYR